MNSVETPHVVVAVVEPDVLEPRSSCCNQEIEVQREVHDTVSYTPEGYDPQTNTLNVRYRKVYEGEADAYTVTCSGCDKTIECEVEEL